MTAWTQAEAIELCRKIEAVAPDCGCHVALTGGTLYKHGERKDADILFYRIRQIDSLDMKKLLGELKQIGLKLKGKLCYGWVQKATYNGKPLDLFFPDYVSDWLNQPASSAPGDGY